MRLSLLAAGLAVALCGVSGQARAQVPAPPPPDACPNVAGHWKSGDLEMELSQKGCELSSNRFEDGGWGYVIDGRWTGYGFNWIMTRVAKSDGCTSRLLGMAVPQSAVTIHSVILRTAGRCDLPPTYGEDRDWQKEVLSYH